MFLQLDESDGRAIYVQVADEIRRQIALGILHPDAPLPAVRQLATDLKVNSNTVQHAYRELVREGTAYVRRGRGTFAGQPKAGRNELSRQRQSSVARQIRLGGSGH